MILFIWELKLACRKGGRTLILKTVHLAPEPFTLTFLRALTIMINFLFLAGTQFFLFRAITGNYPSNNAWTNHGLSMFKTNIFFNFGVSFFYIFLPKIFWRRKVSWECTPECSKLSWRFSRLPGGSAALVGQWQERIKLSCQRLNRRFQRKQETSLTVSFSHRKRTVAQKCHDN